MVGPRSQCCLKVSLEFLGINSKRSPQETFTFLPPACYPSPKRVRATGRQSLEGCEGVVSWDRLLSHVCERGEWRPPKSSSPA